MIVYFKWMQKVTRKRWEQVQVKISDLDEAKAAQIAQEMRSMPSDYAGRIEKYYQQYKRS